MNSENTMPLTVLTSPVPIGKYFYFSLIRKIYRFFLLRSRPLPPWRAVRASNYGGHYNVTKSLLDGLQLLNIEYNYNPNSLKYVHPNIVVLSSYHAMRQAINWKRKGSIDRLIVGPNVLTWPTEHPEIAANEVDVCITPSDWNCRAFCDDLPALNGRCIPWPAGVDTEYWKSRTQLKLDRRKVIIYEKTRGDITPVIDPYIKMLESRGYHICHIVYGNYCMEDYRRELEGSQFLVGFTASESQGIAWAESWSMNVPTFIWKNDVTIINGKKACVSTAPYLTAATGCLFDTVDTLEQIIELMENGITIYTPRTWTLHNMSDRVSALKLLSIAASVAS